MFRRFKQIYRKVVKPVTVPILARCLRFLDSKSWVPVIYISLPRNNTNAIWILHVLHNIQIKTGRRVIVISSWPFFPWNSARDPYYTSFIRGLNRKIHYIFVPIKLERSLVGLIDKLMRILQASKLLVGPMGLHATIRLGTLSSWIHTDIVNQDSHGSRVVFQIPDPYERLLRPKLRDLGVAPDDWFVCVHAREHGYYRDLMGNDPKQYQPENSDHRNVDIRDYFPAIDYIRSQGGLVVRLGDPSMTRLSDIDGLIDYPFTEHQSMIMDLYLISKCRFVLGCSSGPGVAFTQAFGAPALITNLSDPVMSAYHPYSNLIALFNGVKENSSGRLLSLKELFKPSMYAADSAFKLQALGYSWLRNTPEQILEATKEMLNLVETNSFDGPRSKEQEQFHQYRLQEVIHLSSEESAEDLRFMYSRLWTAESRISATFAAHHVAKDEVRKS